MNLHPTSKTAFVLAGGGSLGAVQVGMLKALSRQGIVPDFVVGASVGAINAAYYAAAPDEEGIARLESTWLGLRSADVFPFSVLGTALCLLGRRDYLARPLHLRALIESELSHRRLEDARLPCHVVATDVLDGTEVLLSTGEITPALLASVELRQCVQRALNRGEAYHRLRRVIAYVNNGKFRVTTEEQQKIWNDCARLIANAVIYYSARPLAIPSSIVRSPPRFRQRAWFRR